MGFSYMSVTKKRILYEKLDSTSSISHRVTQILRKIIEQDKKYGLLPNPGHSQSELSYEKFTRRYFPQCNHPASCLRAEFAVRRRSNQAEENVARRVMKTRSTETLRINI